MPKLQASDDKNVFINCPFDKEYIPILHAITFTLLFLGYTPRSALEISNAGQLRLTKILQIISESKFGIHDISRVEFGGTADEPLPRFNMAFECGLFFGAVKFGNKRNQAKSLLVLDSEKHRLKATLSDLAGSDTFCHGGDENTAIACIREFLKPFHKNGDDADPATRLPGEERIQVIYSGFKTALPLLLKDFGITLHELSKLNYWNDYVDICSKYLTKKSPFPAN